MYFVSRPTCESDLTVADVAGVCFDAGSVVTANVFVAGPVEFAAITEEPRLTEALVTETVLSHLDQVTTTTISQ